MTSAFGPRSAVVLYLLGLFALGVGYIALTPAFEGFDETAHFSRIREIAALHRVPAYGESTIDRAVNDYTGPLPYTSLVPPFDAGPVYPRFFADTAGVARYVARYRGEEDAHARFVASSPEASPNWEAQHPPLYYVLLAPLATAIDRLPLVSQVFVLRLASFAFAWLGVVFALAAAHAGITGAAHARVAALGFVLYPIALPMFVPEFARIGNDSLCLLLAGLLSWLLVRHAQRIADRARAAAVGLTLACGLLTKALFVPIAAALVWTVVADHLRDGGGRVARSWSVVAWMLGPPSLVGVAWAVSNVAVHGEWTGSHDLVHLAASGGLFARLPDHFSWSALAHAIASTLASWVWGGSWSLVRAPVAFLVPLLGFVGVVMAAAVGKGTPDIRTRMTAPLLLLFGLGLFHHMLVGIAINGNGNTPGWYLHILFPWLAPLFGAGIAVLWRGRAVRPIVVVLVAYAASFTVASIWSQFALFTGCAVKADDKTYRFLEAGACLGDWPVLVDRLSVLAWPRVSLAAFGVAAACALALSARAVSRRDRP